MTHENQRENNWRSGTVIAAFHLTAVVGAFYAELSLAWVGVMVASYFVRTSIYVTAYHRYLAHKSFKTSRWFQFVLAFLGAMAVMPGPLSWAADHRLHHAKTDREGDIHSPVGRGFWFAHVLWIFHDAAFRRERVKDLLRYPELRILNTLVIVPIALFLVGLFLYGGFNLLYWGGITSTLLVWHSTWSINSVTHLWGSRRFETPDQSRNTGWLAIPLLGMGENWHNNHHRFPSAASQGIRWWEIDTTYYGIRVLGWLRLVWDIRGQRGFVGRVRTDPRKLSVTNTATVPTTPASHPS